MSTFLENKLQACETELTKSPRSELFSDLLDIPDCGGVYAIWSKVDKKPRYVGETRSLKRRYRDLGKTANHTFRRTMMAEERYKGCSDKELSNKLSKEFNYSFIKIDFGRKEVEEYLCKIWADSLMNK